LEGAVKDSIWNGGSSEGALQGLREQSRTAFGMEGSARERSKY